MTHLLRTMIYDIRVKKGNHRKKVATKAHSPYHICSTKYPFFSIHLLLLSLSLLISARFPSMERASCKVMVVWLDFAYFFIIFSNVFFCFCSDLLKFFFVLFCLHLAHFPC